MAKLQAFLKKYKKECIAALIFVVCLGVFSIGYVFAAVEPVRSIVIQSENTDFASGEEGSWQVTKSGYWINYGEAEVTLDVDTSLMTNNEYTDIIFVLDISGSMAGEKLERVKSDSKELISNLLSNQNNRAALITFDTESQIVSELTNDEELLLNEIDNLQTQGNTNYYQALVNVDSILQDYQKESGREMIVLFLTDGYPNEDTPNQITQYQYLKSTYPYITINGIQYEMGSSILNPITEISDNQFIADMDTLNNVLFDASVAPVTYDTYQIVDYIDNENFILESVNNINVSQGSVELTEENGKQKIIWTLDNLKSGFEANLTMKLKLKEELISQGGIYPTNESTEVISKIESQEEDVSTTNTPILADNYKVIYDGNAPEGCTVNNIPDTYNYSVFSTIEISDQIPNCTGYEFKGWSITTNGVTRVSEDYFIMPESDVIIKAEWSKVDITKSMSGTVNNMGDPIMEGRKWFDGASIEKNEVTSIVTKDNMEIPPTAIKSWDVSEAGDGSVIAYIEDDGRGTGTYKVTIGAQGNIIASSGNSLFENFENVEIIDLTYLDTSQVAYMSSMFYYCSSLTSLDLSNFNTSQVTDMYEMFGYCRNLISLDLGHFNTTQVTDMSFMFYNCRNLTSLNVSSFDTSKVIDMAQMFYYCNSLTSLDVSNFNTKKALEMNSMFYRCENLTSLDVSHFDTSQVNRMDRMFYDCSSLVSLDVSNFNTSKVTNMSEMFASCLSVPNLNVSGFDTSQVTNMSSMFSYCRNLLNLDVTHFDTSQVTDMNGMFYNCSSLTNLDVSNFDTSKVTSMGARLLSPNSFSGSGMFSYCSNLTSLDLSHFDTSNVTQMGCMFQNCNNLTNLDISSFSTSKVTCMSYMFDECSNLSELNLSNFDTSQVTTMYQMFSHCSSLTSLNVSSFNTSQVTDMEMMFYNCSSLRSLDLNSFDTSQVTTMSEMFSGCSSLTSLDVSGFDTGQVTDINGMFYDCSNLITLNVSGWNTSNVQYMGSDNNGTGIIYGRYMGVFQNCSSLRELDLSSWVTSNVKYIGQMFAGCTSLTVLDFRNADFNSVTAFGSMFHSVNNNINIIVKDDTAKIWIESRLSDAGRTGTVTIASA